MIYHTMRRIKIFRDNRIIRPTEKAESRSRKAGTAKRVAASMAARLIRRLGS